MRHDPTTGAADDLVPPRIFLREAGWQVDLKHGSDRAFCYQIAPGDESYHRLADGEVYLHRGEERLCLPCAARRGLLSHEPRLLRQPAVPLVDFDAADPSTGYDVKGP
ncbi:MAG: hypothetical protein ABI353_18500 [Isosphaeraceae bacterium]